MTEIEFENNFNEFIEYARKQGATDKEIEEMKASLLDSMIEATFQSET